MTQQTFTKYFFEIFTSILQTKSKWQSNSPSAALCLYLICHLHQVSEHEVWLDAATAVLVPGSVFPRHHEARPPSRPASWAPVGSLVTNTEKFILSQLILSLDTDNVVSHVVTHPPCHHQDLVGELPMHIITLGVI